MLDGLDRTGIESSGDGELIAQAGLLAMVLPGASSICITLSSIGRWRGITGFVPMIPQFHPSKSDLTSRVDYTSLHLDFDYIY
jgi:hypothetical protein